MSLAKILLMGAALAAATPAFADGDAMLGWGGRYGVHQQSQSSSSYESTSRQSSYQADYAGYDQESDGGDGYRRDGGYDQRGYHASGGGYSRSEQTSGGWSYRQTEEQFRFQDRPMCRHLTDHVAYGRRPLPVCAGEGELTLGGDFFEGDAGVGGFAGSEGGGGGGGGYGFAVGGAGASAHAFASASAHASVSIRFRGGFHGGFHGGGHHDGGHKGGCGCGK